MGFIRQRRQANGRGLGTAPRQLHGYPRRAFEGPEECAKRELFEETGILCESFELVKITLSTRSPSLIYSYLAKVDCDKDAIVLQEGETTEYKWVDAAGLLEYAESELAIKSSAERYREYYDKVREQINKQ